MSQPSMEEKENMQHQLVATIALQQKEIDSLNSKLESVLKRLDTLESAQSKGIDIDYFIP